MALLTTILMALSPLLQPANAELKTPEPVVSAPTPGGATTTVAPPVRTAPVAPPAPPKSTPVLASWYPQRPSACWDARGPHRLPPWLVAYTASRMLPCGALVTVSGPAGSITVPVEDYGPEEWTGRAFDLSPAAFEAVAGSLATGVVPVEWSPAG